LNLCNVSKTPPFQNLLHPWVQKKSYEHQPRGTEPPRVGVNVFPMSEQRTLTC
jgi:hypothetical protein